MSRSAAHQAGEAGAPRWMRTLTKGLGEVPPEYFSRFLPGGTESASAVLMLFGPHEGRGGGEDVVLTERSSVMRSHAGQVSFPGGRLDPTDAGPVSAALREAREEIDLDDRGVRIVATLPTLSIPVSNSAVTPVLAWWASPTPIRASSPLEVERVVRVRVADLLEPEHRFTVTHPSGYRGPGFAVGDLFIWGFTAGVLAKTFDLAGLTRPWDTARMERLPARFERRPGEPRLRPVVPAPVGSADAGGVA